MAAQDDKQQIGLTPEADAAIRVIAESHFDGSQQDAYRFAIAYAIGAGLKVEDAETGGYVTKYSLGTVESGGAVRDVISLLQIGDPNRPYATAEKLADLGVRDLARRLRGSETLADILISANSTSGLSAVDGTFRIESEGVA